MTEVEIGRAVKDFLLREFLPDESPEALTDATPLITGGVLDSIGTLKLVSFLEDTFSVRFEAHEVDPSNLNTLADIARSVGEKLAEP